MSAFLRKHSAFIVVFAIAVILRAWKLDAIPNPSGDEGNWTWIPLDLLLGRPVVLPPDARFVPMTFALMIRTSFALFGYSFASARAVCVTGFLMGLVASYAILDSLKLRRAALVFAIVLAIHPWSVLWCRTVSVPYALSLATATTGPLLFLATIRMISGWKQRILLIVASQILFLGMHFSPLAVVPIVSCGLWVLIRPSARAMLRNAWLWIAFGLGSIHLLYVLRGALAVAARGATRPDHQFTDFGQRLYTYGRMIFGGLAGEATVRHFTAGQMSLPFELFACLVVFAFLGFTAQRAYRSNSNTVSEAREIRDFGLIYFAAALLIVPILLAPARPWNLHAIDSERYLFAVLAPFAFILAATAEETSARDSIIAFSFALYFLIPTARVSYGLAFGGGSDHGIYLLHGGGGYRGWRITRERIAIPWLIRHEVDLVAHRRPTTILIADYAFHPIHFVNAETPYPTIDVAKFPIPVRPGERFFFVFWSDGMFAPEFEPTREIVANENLRLEMLRAYRDVQPLHRFVQPNGRPLFEVWTGIQRGNLTAPMIGQP